MTERTCVVCRGELVDKFEIEIRGDLAIARECNLCASLFLPEPVWLEATTALVPSESDVGAVRRALMIERVCRRLTTTRVIARGSRIMDFGSGSGLLVRLLRDHRFDAVGFEQYRTPIFASSHHVRRLEDVQNSFDLVTLIEVLEHLADPVEELQRLQFYLTQSGGFLISTLLYDTTRHGADWWYLDPRVGEHVTFLSSTGMRVLADRLHLHLRSFSDSLHYVGPKSQVDRVVWAVRLAELERRCGRLLRIEPDWTFISQDSSHP